MNQKSQHALEIVTKLSETYKLNSGLSKMVRKALEKKLTKSELGGLWAMTVTTVTGKK